MTLQDGREGGGQDTAVGMPQDHSNHGHVDIQQQIIMTGDGVRMQVVRVVSFGGSRGGDDIPSQIQEQIKKIENALMGEIGNAHDVDKGNEDDSETDENEADEENHPDEKKAEEEDEYDRDINPRGKVLQADLNKEKENSDQDNPKSINDQEKESFYSKIENLEKDISAVEHEIEKVTEITQNDNIEDKVKIKVLDVDPEKSTESSDDDDYDVVHSKTKRIKIEGIPNQAKRPDPPKSIFKNLGPSRQRYTILEKDEL